MLRASLLLTGLVIAGGAAATTATPTPPANDTLTPPPPPAAAFPIKRLNGLLVDDKGRALYTFDGDTVPGKSRCNNQCRLLWPPIIAAADATPRGGFDLVVRDDGSRQWAFRGKPLYRWVSDRKYGDAGGDGVSGKWHLVRVGPAATPAAQ